MKIKDIPFYNRPGFKLTRNGVNSLDDAELLSIIFGVGSKDENAIELSNRLLKKYNLNKLEHLSVKELAKECKWNEYSNYCDVARPCEQYSNNKESCKQNAECQWRQDSYYSYFGSRQGKTPLSLWAIWIFANVIFILLILGIIGYGTWQKLTTMINLGIVFFSLDILTRYIGFAMDFWGYTGLSIMFIAGGLTLLAGGYFIEKWRRNLVSQVKTADNQPKIRSR